MPGQGEKFTVFLVICAWCDKEIDRKPALGHPGVSHGICPECKEMSTGMVVEAKKAVVESAKR